MFKTRLLSGIVLVIAALVLIITGGDVLLVSTLLISWIHDIFHWTVISHIIFFSHERIFLCRHFI